MQLGVQDVLSLRRMQHTSTLTASLTLLAISTFQTPVSASLLAAIAAIKTTAAFALSTFSATAMPCTHLAVTATITCLATAPHGLHL